MVTGAKKIENRNTRNVKLWSAITVAMLT